MSGWVLIWMGAVLIGVWILGFIAGHASCWLTNREKERRKALEELQFMKNTGE